MTAEGIGPATVLAVAGLDSLAFFALQWQLEDELGLPLPAASLSELAGLSLAELSDHLLRGLDAEPGSGRLPPLPPLVPGEILGEHPVSPGQEALWLLEQSAATEGVLHSAAAARLTSRSADSGG